MTKLFSSTRFFYLTLILIIFMLTAFPAAAFADDNEGSAENGQDTETVDSASETPQVQDYSPPASEAPASTDYTPTDSPQDLSAPSDSDLSGAANPEMVSDTGTETDAPATGNSYIAVITPDALAIEGDPDNPFPVSFDGPEGGDTVEFTATFIEIGDKTIGAALIKIPADFLNIQFGEEWTSTGVSTPDWQARLDGQFIYLQAMNEASYLNRYEEVSVTFTADTPSVAGAYQFETKAWIDVPAGFGSDGYGTTAGAGSNNMAPGFESPWVIVGYSVSSKAELAAMALDGYYVQTSFIGIDDDDGGWTPIGTETAPFTGALSVSKTYNALGSYSSYFMNNLSIAGTDSYVGLFGYTGPTAKIMHLELWGVSVEGNSYVGGLVGYNNGGYIYDNDIYANTYMNSGDPGPISGFSHVGGLIGYNKGGNIAECYTSIPIIKTGEGGRPFNFGGLVGYNENGKIGVCQTYGPVNVSTSSSVGGLVGINDGGTIFHSASQGAVSGYSNVGGLVGHNSGTIITASASGAVTGSDNNVGGLAGYNSGTISNGNSSGNVTSSGNYNVGGLVGRNNENGSISNCYATGNVTGANTYGVGGLIGRNEGLVTNCAAVGDVIGQHQVGGLVGENFGVSATITNSFATGNVEGNTGVGGLVGRDFKGIISDCYAIGNVTGIDYVGGLVGYYSYNGTTTNCYSIGAVIGTSNNVGGLIGWNHEGTSLTSCYYNTETSGLNIGIGDGTPSSNVTGLTTAQMKNIASYLGWNITTTKAAENWGGYNPYPFPRLSWELGIGNSPIWYIYDSGEGGGGGNPGGSGGDNPGGNLGADFGFILAPASVNSPVGGLTRIPRQDANAIITTVFVTGGSATDLGKAIAVYNQTQQNYETNKGTLSAAEKAVAEVELAIANAAIKALELSLAVQGGQAFDMAALISAYNNAVAVLNANRALLTAEQIVEAEALLRAIATVISRYST